jgi:hypothetical protein
MVTYLQFILLKLHEQLACLEVEGHVPFTDTLKHKINPDRSRECFEGFVRKLL